MGKKIIFIDVAKARKNCYDITYNNVGNALYIEYWKTDSIKSGACYSVDNTVIFSKNSVGEIWVRSKKYRNSPCNVIMHAPEYPLYDHISEAFKIFDDINAQCKSEGKDPVWMLEFDLVDPHMSAVLRVALSHLFHSFTLSEPACDTVITKLYCDYRPEVLYNMMVKNLAKRDHKDPVDMYIMACRGNGKTALAQKMMLNYIKTGEMPKEENMINFRKNLEYLRRDKEHPNKFNIKFKDSSVIRVIEFQEITKKDLFCDALVENVLIIASQMVQDRVAKVIFNVKNKMTIIFPWGYGLPEKTIVKANGLDAFDILNGYSIAKAKMVCSEDGYEWLSKLRKSGKVDV